MEEISNWTICFFLQGEGKCPFGNKCFYKHAGVDGVLIDVGCPRRARKIQVNDELIDLLDVSILYFKWLLIRIVVLSIEHV